MNTEAIMCKINKSINNYYIKHLLIELYNKKNYNKIYYSIINDELTYIILNPLKIENAGKIVFSKNGYYKHNDVYGEVDIFASIARIKIDHIFDKVYTYCMELIYSMMCNDKYDKRHIQFLYYLQKDLITMKKIIY